MKRLVATLFLLFVVAGCTPAFPLVMDTREPTPEATPTEIPVVEEPVPTPVCDIKGNVNPKGEQIYFTHESINYKNVIVDEDNGDQWFCSEDEAQAAGFRKALK